MFDLRPIRSLHLESEHHSIRPLLAIISPILRLLVLVRIEQQKNSLMKEGRMLLPFEWQWYSV